jgi:NADPH:quinone reductase
VRAIRIEKHGGPEVLELQDVTDPTPGPGEVVVEIAAAGVNFIDTYQRSGAYPSEVPIGLGLEGAGRITAIGEGVTHRTVGDLVGWTGVRGSYAEALSVPSDKLVQVPETIPIDVATAALLQGMTAHYLSHSTYALGRDDTALVYAAAGGVGRLLVQFAKRRGAKVIACTSTQEKADAVRELGADEVILYRDVDIAETVRDLTGGAGVDVVYDSVGKATFEASLDSLKPRGLMVLYGGASGQVPPVDLQILNQKGALYVTRPTLIYYTATPDELNWRAGAVFDLVESGQLDVLIHDRYPLADVARAHRDLESGTTTGKLLLIP